MCTTPVLHKKLITKKEMAKASRSAAVDDAILVVGVGCYQCPIVFSSGFAYAFSSALPLTVTLTSYVLVARGVLPAAYRGSLFSILFCGYIVGNFCGGMLADSLGRAKPMTIHSRQSKNCPLDVRPTRSNAAFAGSC